MSFLFKKTANYYLFSCFLPFSAITTPACKQECNGTSVPPSGSTTNQLVEGQERPPIDGEEQPNTEPPWKLETTKLLGSLSTTDEKIQSGWSEDGLIGKHPDAPVQDTQAATTTTTTHLHHQQVVDLNLNEIQPAESTASVQHRETLSDEKESRAPTVGIEEPLNVSEGDQAAPFPMGELWDEYTEHLMEGEQTVVWDLRSLLSDSQSHQAGQMPQEEAEVEAGAEVSCGPQTGWHIPSGPGLADITHCPLWSFPSMSYYPPFQHPEPLEGEWSRCLFTYFLFW